MKIIISPYSKTLRNGSKKHPKNFPYWSELITLLKNEGHDILQVGVHGEEKLVENCLFNLSFAELKKVLQEADTFISVENFFPHFAHHYGKSGIVLFSSSDPKIFGYPENINLLKSRRFLRPDQFGIWESAKYAKEAFVSPNDVLVALTAKEKVVS